MRTFVFILLYLILLCFTKTKQHNKKEWQAIHQLNEDSKALTSSLGFRSPILHIVVGSWRGQYLNLVCRGGN